MRPLLLALLAPATIACTATIKEPHLDRDGSLYAETEGVVLYEGNSGGFTGMSGTTCDFDRYGSVRDDVAVPGRDKPRVLDGARGDRGNVVLVRTRDTLTLIEGDNWSMDPVATVDFPGLSQAFLTHGGVIGVGGCALRWLGSTREHQHSVTLGGERCHDARITVDPDTSTAFVTAGGEVVRVDRTGHSGLGHRADGALFSPGLDGLLLTSAGSDELRFVTPDGDLLWTMGLDPDGRGTTVHEVADLGARGMLAVTTAGSDKRLVLIDGLTGEIVGDNALPRTAGVVASRDGAALGLVLPSRVELFTVR
jgi:hypothetical protein